MELRVNWREDIKVEEKANLKNELKKTMRLPKLTV
jgi:hypothetical protein